MIIEKKQQYNIVEDDFLTIQSKVNEKKLAKLYGLLSNIYRNPIGAIVREYASNAYDANIEAYNFSTLSYNEIKKIYSWVDEPEFNFTEEAHKTLKNNLNRVSDKEPVIIGILEEGNQPYFYIRDFGIGMSPERMRYIYFNYLDSTKEETDDEIGGFGIGSKSALSYSHTFYIDTIYNGVLYKYIMTKDSAGIPQGQLLYKSEYDSSLENGTTIKIKIKTGDENTFISEITKQLAYMDNLYVDTEYIKDNQFDFRYSIRNSADTINDYKIINGEDWVFRVGGNEMREMHICLGKVSYTIDWTELGINSLSLPIALKFQVGELQPTPSRESVLYGSDTNRIILEKIKKVQNYFVGKYNEYYGETDSMDVYLETSNRQLRYVEVSGNRFDMIDLLGRTEGWKLINNANATYIPFKEKGIIAPHNILSAYKMNSKISGTTAKVTEIKSDSITFNMLRNKNTSMFEESRRTYSSRRNAFLLEKVLKARNDIGIIRKRKFDKESDLDYYLRLNDYPTKKTRDEVSKVIFGELDKYFRDNFINYDEYYPDPNWEYSYDAGKSIYSPIRKRKVMEGKVFTYSINDYYHSFRRKELELQYINSFKGIVIYDEHENKQKVSDVTSLLRVVKNISEIGYPERHFKKDVLLAFTVSKANLKVIEQMENTYTPEEAIQKFRMFTRIVTAYKIVGRLTNIEKCLCNIQGSNSKVDELYLKLKAYHQDNIQGYRQDKMILSDGFLEELHSIAEKYKLYDESIIKELEFLEEYCTGLDLLNSVKINHGLDYGPGVPGLLEFLKMKNKRINNKFYCKDENN